MTKEIGSIGKNNLMSFLLGIILGVKLLPFFMHIFYLVIIAILSGNLLFLTR